MLGQDSPRTYGRKRAWRLAGLPVADVCLHKHCSANPQMEKEGHKCTSIEGGMDKQARDKVVKEFRRVVLQSMRMKGCRAVLLLPAARTVLQLVPACPALCHPSLGRHLAPRTVAALRALRSQAASASSWGQNPLKHVLLASHPLACCREGTTKILISTDVLSRGFDVTQASRAGGEGVPA